MNKLEVISVCVLSFFVLSNAVTASPFNLKLDDHNAFEQFIKKQSNLIAKKPKGIATANNYRLRGDAYFIANSFKSAISDYTTALELNNKLYKANYGRGLALARDGWITEGIADIDIYIKHNPNSSEAFTKRGVRKLWLNKLDDAKKDLLQALVLDPSNAEAHDDIGVVYSKNENYAKAADHFLSAIENDPSYQKAYHNIALISFVTGQDQLALGFVNSSINLRPTARNSLMLKSKILHALGFIKDAQELKEHAEFLPKANWSELVAIE